MTGFSGSRLFGTHGTVTLRLSNAVIGTAILSHTTHRVHASFRFILVGWCLRTEIIL